MKDRRVAFRTWRKGRKRGIVEHDLRKGLGMKTIIIGGVAGGASAAARLRRLDEKAEIVLLEKGPHMSYANCGLPYTWARSFPSAAGCW